MVGRKLGVRLGLALIAVAAVAAAAIGSTASAAGKAPIVIGYAYDAVGQMAPVDGGPVNALSVQIKNLNAKGGIGGRQVVLKTCNTQNSKADVAKACAANLIKQGAQVGLVTCDVDFATPAIQEFLNKGLLTIAPCIGTDQMGPKRFGTKGKLAFSFGNVAQDEGAAMAEYAYKVKKWKTAVTVSDKAIVYFPDVVKAFEQRFKQLGGKVLLSSSYIVGDKTVQNVISQVNAQKADVIVAVDTFADWPAFYTGVRSLGNNTPILNSWAPDGNYWWPKSPQVTNFFYVTYASIFGDDPSKAVQSLFNQLKKAGKTPPSGGFITGAAVLDAVKYAIEKNGGSTNGAKLAKTIEGFKGFPTISGKISFSPSLHSVFGRSYRVIEVENNSAKVIGQVTASSPAKF